jgi:uncharacterized protein
MAHFIIECESLEDGTKRNFYFDNLNSELSDEPLLYPDDVVLDPVSFKKKSSTPKVLKVQLGLSCNYSCEYCSQRFVEAPESTSANDIEAFIEKLKNLDLSMVNRLEYWGGEPFVYWKTLKPLHEALKAVLGSEVTFSIITNGSLLNAEKVDWILDNKIGFSISHDGPGQYVRGDELLEDNWDQILRLFTETQKAGRPVGVSSMLNKDNQSRMAIIDWFAEKFPTINISHYEMVWVDTYNDASVPLSLLSSEEDIDRRRNNWLEIRENMPKLIRIPGQKSQIDGFRDSLLSKKYMGSRGQKCGMDKEDIMAIDLTGNVITCQNTSSNEVSALGTSHKIGHLSDTSNIVLNTATHWTERSQCQKCPVLALCGGSCMFLQDEFFNTSCDNAYSDAIPLFAIAIESLTGYAPYKIYNKDLPEYRQKLFTHTERQSSKIRKPFPIKVVASD